MTPAFEPDDSAAAAGPFGIPAGYFGPPDGEDAVRADELAIGPIEMRAMGALRGLLHDPETGFASLPPEERLAAMPATLAAIEGIGDSHRTEATTSRQRAILDPLLDNHLGHATLQVGRLANQALAEADDGIVERRIGSLQQDAAVNWDDPARLRVLGRAIVTERRAQGERNGWDNDETEVKVRQNASDFYAIAIEAGMDRDLDRAGKLLAGAQSMLLPERQVLLARKLAEAREDRHVASVAGTLAAIPLDPATQPNLEAYRARAEELTPDDASPELRARIALLADAAQRHATKYWQHDRNQAGLAAIDWIVSNPGTPLVTMDRKIADQLSPEQRARLQEIETTGRLDTDPGVYDKLDRLAVYDPKTFAATDLSQYRLDLDGKDYARFTGFQKGDATFARYDRGRTVLDAGLVKAGLDPDDPVARNARGELDTTLRTFETVEGRPPTMDDIERVVGDIVSRSTPSPEVLRSQPDPRWLQSANGVPAADAPNVHIAGGPYSEIDRDGRSGSYPAPIESLPVNSEVPGATNGLVSGRGAAPNVEPPPGSPEYEAAQSEADAQSHGRGIAPNVEPPPNDPLFVDALKAWQGKPVTLPDGSLIRDPKSPTGYVMGPFDDLGSVAAAGRGIAAKLGLNLVIRPVLDAATWNTLYRGFKDTVAQGGSFDY